MINRYKFLKLLFTPSFCFFAVSFSYAQQPQWQLNYSTGNWWDIFEDMHFVDDTYGWVVGYGYFEPLFYMTKDGGDSWIKVQDPTWSNTSTILSVFFTDTLNGWIIVPEGRILKSSDGGYNWTEISQIDTAISFADLYFKNHLKGLAVGGNIIIDPSGQIESGFIKRTTDGGSTWQLVDFDSSIVKIRVCFSDSLHGMVLGWRRHVYTTEDGGQTWTANTNFNPNYIFNDCICMEDGTFVLAGSGDYYPLLGKSPDYGQTWTFNEWQTNQAGTFLSVGFSDSLNGWFGSYDGKFIYTNDGGLTFHVDSSITDENIGGVQMIHENLGWAHGGGDIFRYDIVTSMSIEPHQSSSLTSVPYLKAYPNPFNYNVRFQFELLQSSNVEIRIYDITGRNIVKVMDGYKTPGIYSLTWDGADENDHSLPSGIYFVVLNTNHSQKITKIFHVK